MANIFCNRCFCNAVLIVSVVLISYGDSEQPCQPFSRDGLRERLVLNDDWNARLMADSIRSVVQNFPDLTQTYSQVAGAFFCGSTCQTRSLQVTHAFSVYDTSVPVPDHDHDPETGAVVPPSTSAVLKPAPTVERNSALGGQGVKWGSMVKSIVDQSTSGRSAATSGVSGRSRASPRRGNRRARDLSREDESPGTVIELRCKKPGHEGEPGLKELCGECSAIRYMPDNYYPTFLNQVICGKPNSMCLKGQGSCVAKHLNVRVLKNIRNSSCPYWTKEEISLPVCCECMLNADSSLMNSLKF